MESTPRPDWRQHRLRVRTPSGDAHEVDMRGPSGQAQSIYQVRLAVRLAYELASFLAQARGLCSLGYDWAHDIRAELDALDIDPEECAVEVVRPSRLVERFDPVDGESHQVEEPGAVNGWVICLELPICPRPSASVALLGSVYA
jgi:hypothetical protein